ncbi:polysaccharide lyase 8 family protein [Microbacterium sp. NPDC019599]|uniref:polysaccharide lyase 8 family protein n=1 Tax=Microbacterium sp. NPDC019599 TaxID=3154690 RepID=UPI0033F6707F
MAAVLIALLAPMAPAGAADDPFAVASQRWRDYLTGGTAFDPAAAPYAEAVARITSAAQADRAAMIRTPTTDLWPDLTSATVTADRHETFIRVKGMALAYATRGSALAGDPSLLSDILWALDWLGANRYNTTSVNDGNNWYWALGIPMEINDTILMLNGRVPQARVDAFMAAERRFLPGVYTTGAYSTGANRAWSAKVIALRGVIQSNSTLTAQAAREIVPIMRYVTTGDGYYERGGFIQHSTLPYVGGYGISAIELLAQVLYLFDESPWDVTDSSTGNLQKSVETTYAPFIWRGVMMDSVRGREISREYRTDIEAGSATIRAIAHLADSAEPTPRRSLRAAVKRMLADADLPRFQSTSSLYALVSTQGILADTSLAAAQPVVGARTFASMDRYVHRTSEYAFGVSSSSSRITNFETATNGENQKAWYTADGMTYLYTRDTKQYSSHFWATVNRYRLPGTTVDTRVKGVNDGRNYLTKQPFSGGLASAAGSYGVYGMILDAPQSYLGANKAWFTFDDEIVALGSGINDPGLTGTGWDGRPKHVETIVEDRRVEAADQTLVVDGAAVTSSAVTYSNPAWASLSGSKGRIGYVFPGSESLRAGRTTQTGAWVDVNAKNGSTTPRTDTYFSLWFDHGTAPVDAKYSYVLLPGATTAETKAYAASPDTVVLANSTAVSAVKDLTKNAVGAVFWRASPTTVNVGGAAFLTSSGRSVVSTAETGVSLSVSIADPTQAQTGPITITIDRAAKRVMSSSAAVTVTQLSPKIVLQVNVTGTRGAVETVKLGY